jgi:nitroimidazol reductase NimA-like FMN-containing flavoprotein (pyridoxamine 5'-phosphate oxidase superfamily)
MEPSLATPRTTVKRLPQRGAYDRATINAILDEALICHLGFVADGQPFVIPTIHARGGESVFIHGSQASRMLRVTRAGAVVCLTVTLIDGLVAARSAFHHSMNYRSVVILGTAVEVTEPAEKLAAMRTIVEHIIPGRWDEVRQPSEAELKQTTVLALPITEGSAKIRTGPALDDEADYSLPIWAGVVPLRLTPGAPIRDERCDPAIAIPSSITEYASRRPSRA